MKMELQLKDNMKKQGIFIMLAGVMILLSQCTEKAENVMHTEYGRAINDIYLEVRDGLAYLPNQDEPFNGIVTSNLEDGKKYSESEIINGQPIYGTFYNPDGSIKFKAENVFNGTIRTKHITYYANGVKKSSYDWEIDPETGIRQMKEWHPNGQLKFEGTLTDDGLDGIIRLYDEDGVEIDQTLYEKGEPAEG